MSSSPFKEVHEDEAPERVPHARAEEGGPDVVVEAVVTLVPLAIPRLALGGHRLDRLPAQRAQPFYVVGWGTGPSPGCRTKTRLRPPSS